MNWKYLLFVIAVGLPVSNVLVASEPSGPNLLVLLTDDQRPDTLSCYAPKCPLPTPNIDRLAADGMRFTQGFVTTPICAVSRASILTGRYACNTGMTRFRSVMSAEVFDSSYNMLLQKAGYYTGQLGKYGVYSTNEQIAAFNYFDGSQEQGPAYRPYQGREVHDSEWLTLKTADFLDSVPQGKPFCLQVNYKAPHFSAESAPEDKHLLDGYMFARHPLDNAEEAAKVPALIRGSFLDVCYREVFNKEGDHNAFARDYFQKVASVERSVGEIRAMLEKRGLADNTVIIFLSDHGAHFGDKHFYGKWSPYDPSLQIPLIIYDPRPQAQKKAVRSEMVLNIDLAPTLLDLAGVEVPPIMDGRSLVPLINGESPKWRDHFFFEHYHSGVGYYIARNEGIRTLNEKYLRWVDPPKPIEEFYDLSKDPGEANNLFDDPAQWQRVMELRSRLDSWRSAHPANYVFDPYIKNATFNAPEIDWARFKKAHPQEYAKIAKEVEHLGVTWQQAVHDWETRSAIWEATGYYY
jgi:arylsulfatase A-like enzyme